LSKGLVLGIALFFVFSVVYLRAWGFFSAKAVGLEGLFAATVGNHLYWIAAALLLAFGVVAAAMWPVGSPLKSNEKCTDGKEIKSSEVSTYEVQEIYGEQVDG
jgi:hypothetical protein